MNYKKYQEVRNATWEILIDQKTSTLPIKVTTICANLGIGVLSYKQGSPILCKLELNEHAERTDGFAIYWKKPIIF